MIINKLNTITGIMGNKKDFILQYFLKSNKS